MHIDKLPRFPLAQLPTPIETLPRLSQELGGPDLLIKRDDQTGLALGGNKTRKLEFLVGDALAFLRSYAFTGNELVYADPPYVRSTRRTRARAYRYEMDDHQHVELLALLKSLSCAVMVSGYRSALYDQRLGVTDCIYHQPGLQSAHFSDYTNCI